MVASAMFCLYGGIRVGKRTNEEWETKAECEEVRVSCVTLQISECSGSEGKEAFWRPLCHHVPPSPHSVHQLERLYGHAMPFVALCASLTGLRPFWHSAIVWQMLC
jgi:hypothetical protein